jgi:hypothetical protein
MHTSGNGQQRRTLSLRDAEALTPPVDAVKALQQSLQMALYNGVSEQDVAGVAGKLKEMAMAGDLRAMKMLFELVIGAKGMAPAPPPAPPQVVVLGGRRGRKRVRDLPAPGGGLVYVVGRRPDGTTQVLESFDEAGPAAERARQLAAGGIDYAELTVEVKGRLPLARFVPAKVES